MLKDFQKHSIEFIKARDEFVSFIKKEISPNINNIPYTEYFDMYMFCLKYVGSDSLDLFKTPDKIIQIEFVNNKEKQVENVEQINKTNMQTIEILEKCTIDGVSVRLPDIKLDRNEYMEIEKLILKAGAKKIRGKDFRFDFPTDAQPIIDQLLGGKKIDIKKEFQFFETPKELAKRMIQLADLTDDDYICEPSAGQGAIVDQIPKHFNNVYLFELNETNQKVLQQKGYSLAGYDFLECANKDYFTKIVANPPFNRNQDCTHVKKMYECLKKGGRIVTIMSKHWEFSNNKVEKEFRDWLFSLDYTMEILPANTFKESGTSIETFLIVINK